MRYWKEYKLLRTLNPHIAASRYLEYIKALDAAGTLAEAMEFAKRQ